LVIGALALVAVVISARAALAGPPLVCHPFSIGTAQSLAWTTQPGWRGDVAGYDVTRLVDRTHKSEGGTRADALAWFDAGYFVETFRQAAPIEREKHPGLAAMVAKVDGYAMVQKSLVLRGSDPAIEFAAAIITLDHNRADQPAHAAKAREGAKQDALLAQNIDMLAAWATK